MRMASRGIRADHVELALEYGRTYYARGAVIKVIGRKEIRQNAAVMELRWLEGLHAICNRQGGVITVYRNRRFRKSQFRKPRYPRHL
jgi:hypothetical protein